MKNKRIFKKILTLVVLVCAGASALAAQDRIPDINSRRLLNDLQVTVAQTRQFGDSMTMGLVIRYGAAFDPEEKGGLTNLVVRMLMKSTADRSEQDILAELERLGASIDIRCDRDGIRILLRGRSAGFERALLLLYQIAGEARFEEADFDVIKQSILDDLQKPPDPRRRVHNQFEDVLFQGTTYGRPLEGTPESVSAITPGDVRYFYRRFFSPNQAALVIVGNIEPAAAHRQIARTWGVWVRNDEIPFTFSRPRNPSGREIYVENDRESPAAQFILGGMFPRHEEPDYTSAILAARVLEDRINKLLPTSLLTVATEGRRLASPFYIQGQAAADEALDQIRDVLSVVEEMKQASATDEEIASARQKMMDEFNGKLGTPDGLCNILLDAELYRLGSNYISLFFERVRRSNAETVRKAAAAWFFPDGEILLIRGPLPILKTGLDSLGAIQLLVP
ncbi:MAG: insulinase family protein [Acidobacteriota bacterium]|nr:insulinase family protein [Acidobacteriota bacterium]